MNQQFQCEACKGVYFDQSADGGTYYHACPDLPAGEDGKVPVRENRRDENIRLGSSGRAPVIVSEGAGVTCLSNPQLTEPAWITSLKQRAEKEEQELDA